MAANIIPPKKKVQAVVTRYAKLGGPGLCTWEALGVSVGMSAFSVARYIKKYAPQYKIALPKPSPQVSHIDKHRAQTQQRDDKKTLTTLTRKTLQLEEELNAALQIRKNHHTHTIKPNPAVKSEATAIWQASDWHVGESVSLGQTNGYNEHNPDIARARADAYFVNGLRLTNMFGREIHIDTVVIALLGDFITGHLHAQAVETNYFAPVEETLFAQSLIVAGINYLLKNSKYNLVIVCASGNHGRTTKFSEFGSENGHSHEFFMYCSMRDIFKNEKRVKFVINEGTHTYLEVYHYPIRFLHGHEIKFGGGVGGITIPVRKAIGQWDKMKKAYLTMFGHFHTRFDGGNFMCNGSNVGMNSFAIAMKCDPEPPSQQMCLIDRERGKTIVAPILLS